MDLIINGQAQGEFAQFLQANKMSIGAMRPYVGKDGKTYISVCVGDPKVDANWKKIPLQTNGTLRQDDWKQLDEAIQGVSRERLVGVNALESRGLVKNLANAMGTTEFEYDEMDDPGEAVVSMDGMTRGQNARPNYVRKSIPIPIIHFDYQINERALQASRNSGNGIDVTNAEIAARRVAETVENMLYKDISYTFAGGTIYSYVNHPNRNLATLTKNWDDLTKTGQNILDDVVAMVTKSIEDQHYGPWELYIPTLYQTVLDKDFNPAAPNGITIRERLMKIEGISAIRTVDRLAANNVLLVEMNASTVRLIKGLGLTNVQWGSEGMFVKNFKVFSIMVPQIRSDAAGKSGIVHLSA